jgi:hypothetical protein
VFVRTDAMPPAFADVQVPGVEWVYSDLQEAIVDELRTAAGDRTAREIADGVGCSKEHVRRTLRRLEAMETVQALEEAGSHGATLYCADGLPNTGAVELGAITNSDIQDPYTWSLAIRDPVAPQLGVTTAAETDDPTADPATADWNWRDPGG